MQTKEDYIKGILDKKEAFFLENKTKALEISEKLGIVVFTMVLSLDLADFVCCFFKKPKLELLRLAEEIGDSESFKYKEFLFNNCLLKEHSDARVLSNEDLYFQGVKKIDEILPDVFVEIKKN